MGGTTYRFDDRDGCGGEDGHNGLGVLSYERIARVDALPKSVHVDQDRVRTFVRYRPMLFTVL